MCLRRTMHRKLNLTLTYGPLSLFRWQMYLSQQQRSQWMKYFGETETEGEDEDSLKAINIFTIQQMTDN